MTATALALKDRVCVITGSTSGIGHGIATYFVQLGAKVLVHGRNADRGAEIVAQLRALGAGMGGNDSDADFAQADLTQEAGCRRLIRRAVERFGQIDVLVNNAADTGRGTIESQSVATWDQIFATNVRAPFMLMQEAVAHMKPRRSGSIINIGSVNAYIGEPKLCAYSASKGALMTLTRNAASYLNQYRIRVNQLNVGWTLTEGEDRVKREVEGKGDNWLDEAIKTRPFGRLLSPQDVAYAVAYFASDESAVITGTVMDLEQHPVGAPPNW
jgi:NAD(P)-dependent dehydrogenase (short-subunit alcohol dehydrogenase family)